MKTTEEIQREIDFMRAMYAQRMNENQPRRERMLGAIIILCGVVAVCLAVIAFNL